MLFFLEIAKQLLTCQQSCSKHPYGFKSGGWEIEKDSKLY